MARYRKKAFIWVPREMTTQYQILIDGTNRRDEIWEASFRKMLVSVGGGEFKIVLDNNDKSYTNKFVGGEEVELKLDLSSGSTTRFKGFIEYVKKKTNEYGQVLEIVGSHYQGKLLNITVNASYDGTKTVDEVFKELVSAKLPDFTTKNVGVFTEKVTVNWSNKPFIEVVNDLCVIGGAMCYADDGKDFHLFKTGTRENNDEAAVWNDNLIEMRDLGEDTTDVRNKVVVYGRTEDGSQIIYTTTDSSSTEVYNIKETVIEDTSIRSYDEAKAIGDAKLSELKDPPTKGSTVTDILPSLAPGDKIWFSNPDQGVHQQLVVVSYAHTFPDETTECDVHEVRDIHQVFKERIQKETSKEDVVNPGEMTNTFNFTFDDDSQISSASTGIITSGSKLVLEGASSGEMISVVRTHNVNITSVLLKVNGDKLVGATFEFSVDNGNTWQSITPNNQTSVDGTGSRLRLKVKLADTDTTIDGISLGYK